MDTLMSKVRTALEEREEVIILDESFPQIRNSRKYLKDYVQESVLNCTTNSDSSPQRFGGGFVVALNPGIYSIDWDGTKNSKFESFQQIVNVSRVVTQHIDVAFESIKTGGSWSRKQCHIWTYPYLTASCGEIINGPHFDIENMDYYCSLGKIIRKNRTTRYELRINPLFNDMFPNLSYATKVTLPEEFHRVDFCLSLQFWPNKELYHLWEEAIQSQQKQSKDVSELLEQDLSDKSKAAKILRREFLEFGSVINVDAFNQYFNEHHSRGR